MHVIAEKHSCVPRGTKLYMYFLQQCHDIGCSEQEKAQCHPCIVTFNLSFMKHKLTFYWKRKRERERKSKGKRKRRERRGEERRGDPGIPTRKLFGNVNKQMIIPTKPKSSIWTPL